MPPAKGAAQAVRLAGSKTGDIYRHLVYLVLEQDNAQSAFEGPFFQGMVVSDRSFAAAPGQIFLYAVVHAYAGSHGTYFMGHVQQIAGFKPGDGLHLGRRFYLEDADGVAAAEHVIYGGILEIDTR